MEPQIAKYFLNVELEDDNTPFGGISHIGETLVDFLDECNIGHGAPMDKVNHALIECGIKPINYE